MRHETEQPSRKGIGSDDGFWVLPSVALLILLTLFLGGCGTGWRAKAQPPMVTPCLDEPTAHVPDEPTAPAPGQPITDAYVVAMKGWGNALLGVITSDRITWRGERRCIRRLQDAEQIR